MSHTETHPIERPRWWKAAGIRALKTAAQTTVAAIGTAAVGILQIDWVSVLSLAATAAVLSLLTSLAGLPEIDESPA